MGGPVRFSPRRVQGLTRRVVLVAVGALLVYLVARYRVEGLPDAALSPIFNVSGGEHLLFDRWFPALQEGDTVLFEAGGSLGLARVAPFPAETERAAWPAEWRSAAAGGESLWLVVDRLDHPGPSSAKLGPIPTSAVRGRLLLVW